MSLQGSGYLQRKIPCHQEISQRYGGIETTPNTLNKKGEVLGPRLKTWIQHTLTVA